MERTWNVHAYVKFDCIKKKQSKKDIQEKFVLKEIGCKSKFSRFTKTAVALSTKEGKDIIRTT